MSLEVIKTEDVKKLINLLVDEKIFAKDISYMFDGEDHCVIDGWLAQDVSYRIGFRTIKIDGEEVIERLSVGATVYGYNISWVRQPNHDGNPLNDEEQEIFTKILSIKGRWKNHKPVCGVSFGKPEALADEFSAALANYGKGYVPLNG